MFGAEYRRAFPVTRHAYLCCVRFTSMLTSMYAQEGRLIYYNYEEEIAAQWEDHEVLGEGGFGQVVRATLRGADVAIKVVAGHNVPSATTTDSFLAEVNHVSRLQRTHREAARILSSP